MQGKYYELKDIEDGTLHTGMLVTVDSLRKLTGIRILLDGRTFKQDEDTIGVGVVVGIGEDKIPEIDEDNIFVVYNKYDRTVERPRSERKVILK